MNENVNLKEAVRRQVEYFVETYQKKLERPLWRKPLTGFADAAHPYIRKLKEVIGPGHLLPEEVLPGASVGRRLFRTLYERAGGNEPCGREIRFPGVGAGLRGDQRHAEGAESEPDRVSGGEGLPGSRDAGGVYL